MVQEIEMTIVDALNKVAAEITAETEMAERLRISANTLDAAPNVAWVTACAPPAERFALAREARLMREAADLIDDLIEWLKARGR